MADKFLHKVRYCVEVADSTSSVVLVRDSNHRDGGCLTLRPATWSSFVDFVKARDACP
ncbi:DUF397 domain-containing protein [Streptomyces violaceusniger]